MKERTKPTTVTMSIAILCLLPVAAGAVLTLDWWTVDGGGAMRQSAGLLTLDGSAGQADAGDPGSVGTLSLAGGFWNGISTATSLPGDEVDGPPQVFRMYPAMPNPFNPKTSIAFDLPQAADCRLRIYDLRGRALRTLLDGPQEAGRFHLDWDGRDDVGRHMGSGVYFIKLDAGGETSRQKVVLLK